VLTVNVRYFAALREALGSQESVQMPAGSTVGQLRAQLRQRSARHAELLAPGRPVRSAIAQVVCEDETLLVDGAEVAFFPPVTGG
jgi:sulfur-carrier protein